MKNIYMLLMATLSFVSGYSQVKKAAAAPRDTTESFILTINGKEYVVRESVPLNIKGAITNPVITVRLPEFKKFESGGVSFDYPRHMSVVAEESEGLKDWTLSGNDFIVLYYEFTAQVSLGDIVDEVVSKFGKENCSVSIVERTLGGRKLTGKRIDISMAGQKLIQEFLEIKLTDGKERIIAFQQTPEDNGSNIAEWTKGLSVIDRTIQYH
jgi:hypothetical protein